MQAMKSKLEVLLFFGILAASAAWPYEQRVSLFHTSFSKIFQVKS
jgi:hypothetical protein